MSWFFFILHRVYLILFLWYKHFFRIAASSISLLVTLTIVILFLGVMHPIKNLFTQKLEGSLPGEIIKLRPKKLLLNANLLSLFQEKPDTHFGVTKKEILRFKSWKEIQSIDYTQMLQRPILTYLKHPLLTSLGGGLKFDILMQGLNARLVKPYLFCMKNFKPKKKKISETETVTVIPVVIPDIYVSIAQVWLSVNRLPTIERGALNGLNLDMRVGSSLLQGRSQTKGTKVLGQICGFIPEGIVTTVGAPLSWVTKYHRSQNMKLASDSYDQIFIRVKNSKNVSKIKKKLKKFGLISHTQSKQYSKLFKWIAKIDYIFWFTASILILLSGISLVNSFSLLATEKKYEFGLYLVLGSSPIFIWVMMFFEGVIWGCIHSFLSLKIADLLFGYLKNNLSIVKLYPEWAGIDFSLSSKEIFFLSLGAILFTGLSSMIPSILMMKNKTIDMIKKD